MKNILTQIFVTLGVIFLIIIAIGIYFFITDPLNLKPLIFGTGQTSTRVSDTNTSTSENTPETSTGVSPATGGFQLTESQKQALASFGIDPATVPTSITAEQEACFVGVLGEARVEEVKAGAVPSAFEFLKAQACI